MSAWEVFVQLLPVLAAIGGTAALLSWRQNHNASLRTAWWDRTRWAIEESKSDNEGGRMMGLDVLDAISSTRMTPARDAAIFIAAYRWARTFHESLPEDKNADVGNNRPIREGGETGDTDV